jgi:uncharacterized membrane protein
MTTLVAIAYPDQDTAVHARATVQRLEKEFSGISTAGGAIWGGFWGFLFGTLFLIPFAGWAMGAGLGALFGHRRDNSFDHDALQPPSTAAGS